MTTDGTTSRSADASGQILTEAARRMLPVLAGRVLTAVADRAVEKVEGLADRLDQHRTGERPEREGASAAPSTGSSGGGVMGTAFAFVVEQARTLLTLIVRLASQALEMLRRATEQLRARRAPEGIDEAPEPEEVVAPEDLDEDDAEDDLEDDFEDDLEDDLEEDETEERVTAGV